MTRQGEVVVVHVPTGVRATRRIRPMDNPQSIADRLIEEVERLVRARRRRRGP